MYDYMGALAVFMPREKLNEVFNLGDSYYGGYFSDAPLTEIKDEYVGSVIDLNQLTKVSRQLMVSMGGLYGAGQRLCRNDLLRGRLPAKQDDYREERPIHLDDENF